MREVRGLALPLPVNWDPQTIFEILFIFASNWQFKIHPDYNPDHPDIH